MKLFLGRNYFDCEGRRKMEDDQSISHNYYADISKTLVLSLTFTAAVTVNVCVEKPVWSCLMRYWNSKHWAAEVHKNVGTENCFRFT